jgi:hypothetical protein
MFGSQATAQSVDSAATRRLAETGCTSLKLVYLGLVPTDSSCQRSTFYMLPSALTSPMDASTSFAGSQSRVCIGFGPTDSWGEGSGLVPSANQ